jgi:hypothetical protein
VSVTDAGTGFVGEHKQCSDKGRAEQGKLGCVELLLFSCASYKKHHAIEELLLNDLSSNRTDV